MKSKASSRSALVLSHLAFEDTGTLGLVLTEKGFQLHSMEPALPYSVLPPPSQHDLVIILGGPIGVYEENKYPNISREITFLKERLTLKKPVIGICLGAQMMAKALGAKVYPSGSHEIGWAPLYITESGQHSPLALLEHGSPMLHWHGDTFDLPPGLPSLARTDLISNQAFAIENFALALQFHPEIRGRDLERWLIGHTVELALRKVDLSQLRIQTEKFGPDLERRATAFFSRWLSEAGFF